jgi:hypothetical protein
MFPGMRLIGNNTVVLAFLLFLQLQTAQIPARNHSSERIIECIAYA